MNGDKTEHSIISSDGVTIGYISFGAGGQPLVISHGGFTVADEWFDTAQRLATQRRVVVIERRGRGRSGDADIHSLEQETDDLARVVAELGGDVDLLGHSYGGALSLDYALRTGFEGKLVLYEPTTAVVAPVGGEKLKPVRQLFDRGETEKAQELLYTSVLRMPADNVETTRNSPAWDHHRRLLATFLREVAALDGFAPTVGECAALDARVALLLGSQADQWTKNNAGAFVQRIAGMTLLPIYGQSHFAHLTDPGLLVDRVEMALNLLVGD
ncbi:alpha/beta fold hydrolase [Kineobactrum salinum]|uniref:Alpha/beta hydrolase n=1 Tax=Kineobactrum salinum TaxID=2708301 RepID=A0A6C0U638_9GAMM|nr:alpha/beta hydrolase [Kineobactrum salinum]QIB64904.1 alpha/beta hydrolase [Kineobactrum salinum]